jgi:predicted nuclease with TOPRIM domain
MKSIKLRDKLNTAMKCRIDDLSFDQAYVIRAALRDSVKKIEENIRAEESYIERHKDDEKVLNKEREWLKYFAEELSKTKEILNALENDTVVKLDCYSDEADGMCFNTIIKKYKKI